MTRDEFWLRRNQSRVLALKHYGVLKVSLLSSLFFIAVYAIITLLTKKFDWVLIGTFSGVLITLIFLQNIYRVSKFNKILARNNIDEATLLNQNTANKDQ